MLHADCITICFVGLDSYPAGRKGDAPSVALSGTLERMGFTLSRLKTGEYCTYMYKAGTYA